MAFKPDDNKDPLIIAPSSPLTSSRSVANSGSTNKNIFATDSSVGSEFDPLAISHHSSADLNTLNSAKKIIPANGTLPQAAIPSEAVAPFAFSENTLLSVSPDSTPRQMLLGNPSSPTDSKCESPSANAQACTPTHEVGQDSHILETHSIPQNEPFSADEPTDETDNNNAQTKLFFPFKAIQPENFLPLPKTDNSETPICNGIGTGLDVRRKWRSGPGGIDPTTRATPPPPYDSLSIRSDSEQTTTESTVSRSCSSSFRHFRKSSKKKDASPTGMMTVSALNYLAVKSIDSVTPIMNEYRPARASSTSDGPTQALKRVGSNDSWENDSEHHFDDFGEENENVTLMYVKHEKIPMKDFGSEVRATMDIDHLLNKAVLLMDLPETSLEEIFGKVIHVMDIQEPEFTSEQVKNALFTQDAGNQFHILSRTVQSVCTSNIGGGTFDYDQAWICALCMLPTVQHRHVAIARLSHPTNLGRTMQDLRFIMIVIAPARAKGTKTALETVRTFATLFADLDIRQRLIQASNADQFRQTLLHAAKDLAVEQSQWRERKISIHFSDAKQQILGPNKWYLGRGLKEDFHRRKRHYIRDYLDAFIDLKTIQKVFSTTVFVYFACLLPSIAFGVLNYDNTHGAIGVKKAIYAQAIGGLFFSIFGGQPMIIVLTTAPLALYTKIIFQLAQKFDANFLLMYAWSGIWCQIFLILYAITELSNIMKWATRSAEEIFSLFIALAFVVESFKALSGNFKDNYHSPNCKQLSMFEMLGNNGTSLNNETAEMFEAECRRDSSLLYLLLMLGTLWIGLFLYNFKKTPYLTVAKREMLADYSFPAAVIIMSFCGSYCFKDVHIQRFEFNRSTPILQMTNLLDAQLLEILGAMGLGFCLSLLFFIDQNMASAIVNNQQNKLHKGSATHLDLLVVAILNIFLSIMGLPWMHAALPHSPLHVRALATVEERIHQGHVHEVIINVRETRIAAMTAHVIILISAFTLLPEPLDYIPTSVLDGLFLYMAATSLHGNELVERIMLLFTEQAAYPPTHYIRRVPQRKVHLFTACQLLQLAALCVFGFTPVPYVEMVFPLVIFCFLPIRHLLIPKLIDYKYLDALDGRH